MGSNESNFKSNKKIKKYIIGKIETNVGEIKKVSTNLTFSDTLGHWKARWGINRNNYKVDPELYAVNSPDENSDVFVTANYKFTFDLVRKSLAGLNGWILVLDTNGINVWCAAGKGTFGTEELIKRLIETKVLKLIKHNRIILPQLGAVGVDFTAVRKNTGMKVIYGPIYCRDIKEFIENNYSKTDKMKEINFNFLDRMVLIPIELVQSWLLGIICLLASVIISFIEMKFKFSAVGIMINFIPFAGAILTGVLLFPLLLPIIPFKSFSLKGAILGAIWAACISILLNFNLTLIITNILLLTPVTSFLTLNFTGASTYTSITGTKFEVKISVPIMIISLLTGLALRGLSAFKII